MEGASSLLQNISSDLIEGYNALQPKADAKRIAVYVESDEDIAFWRVILHEHQTKAIKFDIQTTTHKGKTGALERNNDILSLNVGEYLIICVDSDHDFLLPGHTAHSKLINASPHIFQTYSYSIENLLCFSNSLALLCTQATKNDKEIIDFNGLLSTYSEIISELFLWNLYFRKINDYATFTLSAFCDIIKLTDKIDVTDNCAHALTALKARVDQKVATLNVAYPAAHKELSTIKADLEKNEITDQNTYLFIQGHTLKDNVVLMVLKPLCQLLVSEKFEAIKNNAQHAPQAENDRNYYKNQKQDISSVLNSNTEFKACPLYKMIRADLNKYIADLTASLA